MGVAERADELDTELDDTENTETGETHEDTVEGAEGGDDEGEDEDVVQIGSEEPPASEETKAAPEWVKNLRQRQRELAKENAELKAKLGTGQPAARKPELPPKPKLADFDYDEDEFDKARDAWDAKKREIDAFEADQERQAKAAQDAVKAVHAGYAKSKDSLKVKDFQAAEDEFMAQCSEVQQSLVIAGASNPALIVYALGSNPKKLQELASIKDPVKFAVAIGKLETEVKVTKRTSTKPPPETPVRSGSGSATTSTAALDRLRAEAAKTGDLSKVVAYKNAQRARK